MLPIYLFLVPPFDPQPGKSITERFKGFDYIGAVLSIGAQVALIMAINFGGSQWPWNSGRIIALFVISGILFLIFAIQQSFWKNAATRMFPVHFIRNKEAILLFIAAAACNACAFIPIYYIPIYFQFTRGDNALQSAVRLLPLIFLLTGTILLNGYLMSKLGYYQPWYMAGAALALVATVLLSRITTSTSPGYIYGFETLLGIGAGAFIQAGYAVIQAVVDAADMSYAISFMMIAQIGGITLGLAIASAAFVNGAESDLQALVPTANRSDIEQMVQGTGSTFLASLDEGMRRTVLDVVLRNMQKVFIVAYVGAAVALIVSAFLKVSLVDVLSVLSCQMIFFWPLPSLAFPHTQRSPFLSGYNFKLLTF